MISAAGVSSPYKGLAPFEDSELDALLFFGREAEKEIVAMNILAARLTVLYGPSGVGKSSLLRAGVAGELRVVAPDADLVVFSSWRDDPVGALRRAIAPESDAPTLVAAGAARDRELCLVLDQFEEYFLYHAQERGEGTLVEELPALVKSDLRVNVLIGIREDALAKLDVFKPHLPRLFGNYLRLDHLDRAAGRAAIVGPLGRYRELTGEDWHAEPELVEVVLDEVAAGKIDVGGAGHGVVGTRSRGRRVEAPFLQLVLQRLWDLARAGGTTTLTLASLRGLGGSERIVEDHLERSLATLTPEQQNTAAAMFGHLVTPSGTKIAHRLDDLATYASVQGAELAPIVASLADERILRPLRDGQNGDGHYEIYHDVLAEAVLLWLRRHQAQRELEAERTRERERYRRVLVVLGIAAVALAAMTAVAVYALGQRSDARAQAALAREQQHEAARQRKSAQDSASNAQQQRKAARTAEALAKRKAAEAQRNATRATDALGVAEHQTDLARAASVAAAHERDNARAAQGRAKSAATEAGTQKRHAQLSAAAATTQAKLARRQARIAKRAQRHARAGELAALALSNLQVDPQRSVQLAVRAARLETSPSIEQVLRRALLALRLRAILPAGGGAVTDAAFSPKAGLVATSSSVGGVRLFDATSYRLLHILQHPGATTVVFSPDARLVASGARDGSVRVWEAGTGRLVNSVGHRGAIVSLGFTRDGQTLLTASTDGAALWNAATGLELRPIAEGQALRGAVFSPDDRRVLTWTGGSAARVYETATGNVLGRLDQVGEVTTAEFSPQGDTVATAGRRNVYVWDTRSWQRRHLLEGHTQAIRAVAYSPDGQRLVSAGIDGAARVWDVVGGRLLGSWTGHSGVLLDVAYSPDGTALATASSDRTARVWPSTLGAVPAVLAGHRDSVTHVEFSSDGRSVLTAGVDGDARVWDPSGDPQLALVGRHGGAVNTVAASRDGRLVVSGGSDGTARVWRLGSHAPVAILRHGGALVRASFDRAGTRVLTWGDNGEARLWRASGTGPAVTFDHGAPVSAAAISRDGAVVVTAGTDGTVRIWPSSGGTPRTLANGSPVNAIALTPDGATLATGAADGVARLWNMRDGRLVHLLKGHSESIVALAFSPNGKRLATASADHTARLWDVGTGHEEHTLEGHDDVVTSVVFSPTGRLVLTASRDSDARLWSAASGRPVRVFRGHVAIVSDAEFSPDGRWVVTAGPGAAGIWQTSDASLLFFLRGHTGALRAASFATANRIVTGSVDGTVRTYLCAICGREAQLRRLAEARLAQLARANAAARAKPA